MVTQLTLGVQLRDSATFDNFFIGENAFVTSSLKDAIAEKGETFIYLWGQEGVGRTHLLQACCQWLGQKGQAALYLPLVFHQDFTPNSLCEDLETLSAVCIDDVNEIAGNSKWEEALFHLFNRMQAIKRTLIMTGNAPSAQLKITLPDLKSRLGSGVSLQIKSLSDDEKLDVLKMRAHCRGLVLSDQVGNYLLSHYSRHMSDLLALLERLDKISLEQQRRLTIPFVKSIL